MKIKDLLKICNEAPDQNATVFMETIDDNGNSISTKKISYNFDDNNDLDMYIIG